jgi:GNAT superfamily N-acetyltransferase
MAVDHHLQGRGVGALLLTHGVAHAQSLGACHVWARARDAALRFYEKNDFIVVGDAFHDDATGMSHHLVVRFIDE